MAQWSRRGVVRGDVSEENIKRLVDDGLNDKQIGDMLNYSARTIGHIRCKYGIYPHGVCGRGPKRRTTHNQQPEEIPVRINYAEMVREALSKPHTLRDLW